MPSEEIFSQPKFLVPNVEDLPGFREIMLNTFNELKKPPVEDNLNTYNSIWDRQRKKLREISFIDRIGGLQWLINKISLQESDADVFYRLFLTELFRIPKDFTFDKTYYSKAFIDSIKYAGTNMPVLISGESGTGKEIFADIIHFNSDRSNKKIGKLNCATLVKELAESLLFGYKKGSHSQAVKDHDGFIKSYEGGTILFDEIDQMDNNLQGKILRLVEYKKYFVVGDNDEQSANVRFIFATNKDLNELVRKNSFIRDLYYRINDPIIELPTIRSISKYYGNTEFLQHLCRNRLFKILFPDEKQKNFVITDFMKSIIQSHKYFELIGQNTHNYDDWLKYDWPGNVRQFLRYVDRSFYGDSWREIPQIKISDTSGTTDAFMPWPEYQKKYMELIEQHKKKFGLSDVEIARLAKIDRGTLKRWKNRLL